MFEEKPDYTQFAYYYVKSPKSQYGKFTFQKIMQPAFLQVREKYDIFVKDLPYCEMPLIKDGQILYVIYGPVDPFDISIEEKKYLEKLGNISGSKVNIVSVYELENGHDSCKYKENVLDVVRELTELNVNVIYPDEIYEDQNLRSTDWEDVRDNIICETVRVKYDPVRQNTSYETDISIRHTIEKLRVLFEKFCLWHRDPTDGAVMVRDNDKNWIVSQTKTDKSKMKLENFSLVESFDEKTKEIFFSGYKIPSSDAPEFLTLDKLQNGKYNLIVHFHYDEITRSKNLREFLTETKIEYGQFESGKLIYSELCRMSSHWLILLEHGILWLGNTPEEFEDFLAETLSIQEK